MPSPGDSAPVPGDASPPRDQSATSPLATLKNGVACLVLLVGVTVVVCIGLAYLAEEPAIVIAVVALLVALSARQSRRRR